MKARKLLLYSLLCFLPFSALTACDNKVNSGENGENENLGNNENQGGNESGGNNDSPGGNENTGGDVSSGGNENDNTDEEEKEEIKDIVITGDIQIKKTKGYEEGLYVEFAKFEHAKKYEVQYFNADAEEYKVVDEMLIREYPENMRVDILGLAKGYYDVRIVPILEDGSYRYDASTKIEDIHVSNYNREGFCFNNSQVPGAYKLDGTLKDNAIVLYVTNENKDTIKYDVLTGKNYETLTGIQNIIYGFKKGLDKRPISIRLIGNIDVPTITDKGDIVLDGNKKYSSGLTLEGVGSDATANGWGVRFKGISHAEVRNIGFMNTSSSEGDNIGLQQDNTYIWVHHNDLFYGQAGGDSDQAKGDGALDCKRSNYVTMSYNHFFDTGKSNLLGNNDGENGYLVTYHHNWYDHSDSRHPRVRLFSAHVYNNYYDGVAKYGIGNTTAGSVFSEGNYFRNCGYPMLISQQGSDIYGGAVGTFSGENGGIIKSWNDHIEGAKRFVPYSQDNVNFDAYVANSRDEVVPSSVVTLKGGHTYDNFDTNSSIMYKYKAQTPEEARDDVIANAGRLEGGDFKWTFTNADDSDYSVNSELKSALVNYRSSLVKVGFDSSNSSTENGGSGSGNESTGGNENQGGNENVGGDNEQGGQDTPAVNENLIVHNFTTSGKDSSFFSITGNLSTSKGTVTYNGLTLTQCLKLESSTNISFTITSAMRLTLVFNSENSKNIKVDGVKQTYEGSNYLIIDLEPGQHTITKADTSNLFYIQLELITE